MGASANDAFSAAEAHRVQALAEGLGAAIARAGCILFTRATTIPGIQRKPVIMAVCGVRQRRIAMSVRALWFCPTTVPM
jgi:hypothetical protein